MPGDYCTAHLPRRSRTSDPIPRSWAILDFTAERVFQTAELYNQLNGTGGDAPVRCACVTSWKR